jgi:hypothetical protein
MTGDDRISADFAALARRARDRVPPLVATLAKLATPAEFPATLPRFVLERAYVHRVARGAGGAMALACLAALLVFLGVVEPNLGGGAYGGWPEQLVYGHKALVAIALLCAVLVVHLVASRIAERRFERASVRVDPLQLVTGVDAWTTVLAVAGAMASVLVFGMLFVIVGDHSFEQLVIDESWRPLRPSTFGMLVVLIVAALVGGWFAMRRVLVERPMAIFAGFVVLLVVASFGLRFDNGCLGEHYRHMYFEEAVTTTPPPPDAIRIAMTIIGTFAVYLVVGGMFARARRRELAEVAHRG